MSNFRSVDRSTGYLLPPSVDEWLPADHLARFVGGDHRAVGSGAALGAVPRLGLAGVPPRDAGGAVGLWLCHGDVLEPAD
jgi:hypothetical protein